MLAAVLPTNTKLEGQSNVLRSCIEKGLDHVHAVSTCCHDFRMVRDSTNARLNQGKLLSRQPVDAAKMFAIELPRA